MNYQEKYDAKAEVPPHVKRMAKELFELNEKVDKLSSFCITETYDGMAQEDRALMDCQLYAMTTYREVLGIRLKRAKRQEYSSAEKSATSKFHVVGPIGQISVEDPFDGHSRPDFKEGFFFSDSGSIDAPLWLPSGGAQCFSSHLPRDYGRMVRRERCL